MKIMELSLVNKLKQLPIEPTYVVTEKNADIVNSLHLLETNREIKPNKVDDIVKAIQEGLFIPPIIVSAGTFTVIEGAHRTSAYRECLRRGIPFTMKLYLVKDVEATETCMLINNTQKSWKANDRLISYVKQKKSSYIILKSFMEKHSKYFMKGTMYNVTAALALLSPLSSNNAEAAFRDGTLVITEEMVKKAMPTLNQLKLIGEILGARRGTGEADSSPFRRYRIKDWIRARDIMNISVDQFMNRLKRRVDSGRWEEPSEKNWFNSYIEVASLKR
jgi:hypothetical protein